MSTDNDLYPENVHLPYNSPEIYYHLKAAELAVKYSGKDRLSVLDCSCGLGNTSKHLMHLNPDFKLTIADIDENCLKATASKVDVDKSLHVSDISDLFVMPERYDVIILSHVLEHLERPVDSVNGLLSMLKSDGVLILLVPNSVTPLSILGSLLRRHTTNRGHVFAWDRSNWRVFLEDIVKADIVEHTQDLVPLPFVWRRKLFQPIVKALTVPFPWFSFSHISVIKKSLQASTD